MCRSFTWLPRRKERLQFQDQSEEIRCWLPSKVKAHETSKHPVYMILETHLGVSLAFTQRTTPSFSTLSNLPGGGVANHRIKTTRASYFKCRRTINPDTDTIKAEIVNHETQSCLGLWDHCQCRIQGLVQANESSVNAVMFIENNAVLAFPGKI